MRNVKKGVNVHQLEASKDLWYKPNDFFNQSFLKTCCFFVVVSTNSTMMVGSIEEVPVWQDKFHIYIFCFVL